MPLSLLLLQLTDIDLGSKTAAFGSITEEVVVVMY
jgi:hypothetical protein